MDARSPCHADGRVNLGDAAAILRYAVGEHCFPGDPVREPRPGCLAAYDTDGNGCTDWRDG